MYILKICTVVILVYYVTMLEAMMMMSVDKISGEAEIARDISHMKCFLLLFDSFYILHPKLASSHFFRDSSPKPLAAHGGSSLY